MQNDSAEFELPVDRENGEPVSPQKQLAIEGIRRALVQADELGVDVRLLPFKGISPKTPQLLRMSSLLFTDRGVQPSVEAVQARSSSLIPN